MSRSLWLPWNQRSAHSRFGRSGVINGRRFWRRVFVLMPLVAMVGTAEAGTGDLGVSIDQNIQFVASMEKGERLFQGRCATCHATQEASPGKFGPNLHGLFGRRAASLPDYQYSSDLRASRIVWNAQTLDEYLADPHRGRPGDKMPYPGLSSKTDRDDIISYLQQATR